MNILKNINYTIVNWQMQKGHTFLFGKPYFMVLDTISYCNLECNCCPTGRKLNTRAKTIMSLEQVSKILDYFGNYLKEIVLFNWGEPLLNPNITEVIKEIKKNDIFVTLSTNLNVNIDEQKANELISSGLDRLICSIDGTSQETYEKYRKKGDFDKAFNNLKLLINTKRNLKSKTPFIEWQFLVFKHNEHEIEQAEKLAKEIRVDNLNLRAPWCPPEMVSTIDKYNNYIMNKDKQEYKPVDKYCNWLWNAIVINANGSVSPCCSVENENEDFGNIFDTPFYKLWNNKNFRQARKFNITRKKTNFSNRCTVCEHIGTVNHRCK
ncbi:MAG: radical SAM protein [Endomicrobiaceae bacterium]|nr:radical SAM protein [Endomicrobiaceae bacterium]